MQHTHTHTQEKKLIVILQQYTLKLIFFEVNHFIIISKKKKTKI
jgi:hypothetical protein